MDDHAVLLLGALPVGFIIPIIGDPTSASATIQSISTIAQGHRVEHTGRILCHGILASGDRIG